MKKTVLHNAHVKAFLRAQPDALLRDYLELRGLTKEWLDEQCGVLGENSEATNTVLKILSDLLKAGIALPPVAANLVSEVLLAIAGGNDARELVSTTAKRGRPAAEHTIERRIQAGACLALMNMAEFPRGISVKLLASVIGLSEREVEDIAVPDLTGEWNHRPYLIEMAGKTLAQVQNAPTDIEPWRTKFVEFCSFEKTM